MDVTYLSDHETAEFITLYYFDKDKVGNNFDKLKDFQDKNGSLPIHKKSLDLSLSDLLGTYIKRLDILWSNFKIENYEKFDIEIIEE
ncbi:MAG: hypothetical protein FXF54_00265 [Kosmotoga sp.]|nr:MAG: hypothetical protein FXF54_00265 [Kosmotoga sp.]